MSTRYPGGIITKTPVVPDGPGETGAAPGIWTLDQQLQAQKAGIWPTAGNPGADAYIENLFSTWLYEGNPNMYGLTITNGINLSGKGGMVWIKSRSDTTNHALYDTARGATFDIASNTSAAQTTQSTGLTAFSTTGFSIGDLAKINTSAATYAAWTFRKQPKFFDIVTYTGNSTDGRTVSHNLGSVPGCIFVKRTSGTAANWQVYHRSLTNSQYLVLNSTAAVDSSSTVWNNTTPTSSVFTLGDASTVNASGETYVAYLFAHNAGGFGTTGTDNVISCGTFTTDGSSNATVTLGYEPQFVIFKRTNSATNGEWVMFDNMRGMPATGSASLAARLKPNETTAENLLTGDIKITSTGFVVSWVANAPMIYIAIRRGPMKVPTDATKVFSPQALNAPTDGTQVTTSFPIDLSIFKGRGGSVSGQLQDRLRILPPNSTDNSPALYPDFAGAESGNKTGYYFWNTGYLTSTSQNAVWWNFRRSPGFLDVVCYTGTGSNTTQTHNLLAVPELMIVKQRSAGTSAWQVYSSALANTQYIVLNTTAAVATGATRWNSTTPTSSVFSIGTDTTVNGSAATYVAYLFATVAGVSKVGSYTGTGTTQQIDCGFTAGSRFIMIKRTDSTGDWYVWDSARGIIAGNDPYLFMNSTAAEVSNTDYVDTYSAGFEISSTAPAAINDSGGSFIFLAIA